MGLLQKMLMFVFAILRYALQRGLEMRSVVLLHLSAIKRILNKCDFVVYVCEWLYEVKYSN